MRNYLARAFALAVGIAIALAGYEIAARRAYPSHESHGTYSQVAP